LPHRRRGGQTCGAGGALNVMSALWIRGSGDHPGPLLRGVPLLVDNVGGVLKMVPRRGLLLDWRGSGGDLRRTKRCDQFANNLRERSTTGTPSRPWRGCSGKERALGTRSTRFDEPIGNRL
jgi:hypothetical protein